MKTIKEHIKNNQFNNFYLLYGEERALMKQYRDLLTNAICPEDDGMNIARFVGKGIPLQEVVDQANTLPFFANHRLIVIEDSHLFTSSNDLASYLDDFPDTTYTIFVESEIDKRNKLYKAVASKGYIAGFVTPTAKEMTVKIVADCKKAGKQITKDAVDYIIENSGITYGFLCMEMDKLLDYMGDRTEIHLEDVKEICNYQAEDKMFAMIDAIGNQNCERAIELYHDLIYLRKPATVILFNLTRMVNILLQVCDMQQLKMSAKDMAGKLGLTEGVVYKYLGQLKKYERDELLQMLENCQVTDAGIKQGKFVDSVGLELLIVEFSTKTKKQ